MDERNLNAQMGEAAFLPNAQGAEAPEEMEMPAELRAQLAAIRAMDPEMTGLAEILQSEAGERFRDYVARGLDFVDAYTLAAREKLQALRDERVAAALRDRRREESLRAGEAGKRHLAATASRGEGSISVPSREMEMIRMLNPGVSDAEIRRYYNLDRKRFAR